MQKGGGGGHLVVCLDLVELGSSRARFITTGVPSALSHSLIQGGSCPYEKCCQNVIRYQHGRTAIVEN